MRRGHCNSELTFAAASRNEPDMHSDRGDDHVLLQSDNNIQKNKATHAPSSSVGTNFNGGKAPMAYCGSHQQRRTSKRKWLRTGINRKREEPDMVKVTKDMAK